MQPLNEQHRELLSAWLDGELTAAELAAIKDLLQRDDAKAYIAELEQTRMLVTRHAMVKAPADLATRVLARIGEGSGGAGRVAAIHQLPTATWRTPLYAIAAALLVALGIMFGPALVSPKPEAPRDVAREVIDQNSQRGSAGATADKPAGTESDFEGTDAEEMLRRATDDLRLKRDGTNGDNWGKEDEVSNDPAEVAKTSRGARPATGAPANSTAPSAPADNELRENAKTGKNGSDRKVGGTAEGQETERDEDQYDGANAGHDEPAPKTKGDGKKLEGRAEGAESKDASKGAKDEKHDDSASSDADTGEKLGRARRVADKGGEDTGGGSGGSAGKVAGGAGDRGRPQAEGATEKRADEQGATPKPAPQPGEDAAADAGAQIVVLKAEEALAAQNDVLWIASLYGAATLKDEGAGTESVSVDLPEDQLDALLKAIRRLAGDQDYATLEAPGVEGEEPAANDGRISGYLPGKEPERNHQAQQRTVRLIVKFK